MEKLGEMRDYFINLWEKSGEKKREYSKKTGIDWKNSKEVYDALLKEQKIIERKTKDIIKYINKNDTSATDIRVEFQKGALVLRFKCGGVQLFSKINVYDLFFTVEEALEGVLDLKDYISKEYILCKIYEAINDVCKADKPEQKEQYDRFEETMELF